MRFTAQWQVFQIESKRRPVPAESCRLPVLCVTARGAKRAVCQGSGLEGMIGKPPPQGVV